jgi:iron complex transport system substrate-binding protein
MRSVVQLSSRFLKRSFLCLLALATIIVCLISACDQNPSANSTADSSAQISECRVIEHAMGETCVPLNPQRVIALDPFSVENMLALGIEPIGFAMASDWLEDRDYLRDKLSGIEMIGDFYQPNLEKVLSLKPDLILGTTGDEASYSKLAQIAPTVLFKFESSGQWKEILMHNAETLGVKNVADQLMKAYDDRLDNFRDQIGRDVLDQLTVSIVRITDSGVAPYLSNSFCSKILEDAGLKLILNPGRDDDWLISKERISELDADVMFVWSYGYQPELAQEEQTISALIKTDPLWQSLKSVQQGNAYAVPSYWIGSGILSANAVIDDLFKHLVDDQ